MLLGLRLIIISTLFLGALIIQVTTRMILPLSNLYGLFLATYGLSLVWLVLYLQKVNPNTQALLQLIGDIGIVTGFVYSTGGLYSPFSFLYLTVIVVSAVFLRRGAFLIAGLSAIVYGLLVDLMVFGLLPIPPNLVGTRVILPPSRVFFQLLVHVVGFVLVALLVSYLAESLSTAHSRLEEEQQRASQFAALTDHVVRSMGAGIAALDRDGRVLHLNPAGARILAVLDPEAAIGLAIEEVMPLEDLRWDRLCEQAAVRPLARLETQLSGNLVRLGMSIGPLDDDHGRPVGFVVNFQDLSEMESEAEARRMKERMAAVGEMSARMAHEIKNPLASISGSAQVLASMGGSGSTGGRLLDIIVDESRRLSAILDHFLDYARPHQTTQQTCDLSSILRDGVDLLRRSAEVGPNHHIELRVPERLPVLGDPNRLRQVFWNLARNALQAMPDGGDLTVTAKRRGNTALTEWIDTGCGMPEEVRRRAFEPFVTTQPGGTGLGLAIVYTVVDEHGGSVEIDSTPGGGTTITVELPLYREVG
jgi:two-component system sensor histidine kinase PilS (NtrC family)